MNDLIIALKSLITQAGEIAVARKKSGLFISYKEDESPVTNADKEISDLIFAGLSTLTPDILVVCEERPKLENFSAKDFWLIDPIDGTRSYIKGDSTYTINIALMRDLQPSLGLIYQPEVNKLYYTDANGMVRIEQNGELLELIENRVTQSIANEQGLLLSKLKAIVGDHNLNRNTKAFLSANKIHDLSVLPSTMKLCLLAEGIVHIYPRFGRTMEWDIAAGHALIRAVGGEIITEDGNPLTYGKADFENPNFFACSHEWLIKSLYF